MRALSKKTHRAGLGFRDRLRLKLFKWWHLDADIDYEVTKKEVYKIRLHTNSNCASKKTQLAAPREDHESVKDFSD